MKNRSLALSAIYIWLFAFALIPIALTVAASFLSSSTSELITLPFTLSNYQSLFSPLLLHILLRSLGLALVTTFFCLALAYPFSYFMVKSKHQSLMLLFIIIPFWTSSLIRTYALIAILKFNGLLNTALLKLHIISSPITFLYTNFAVISGLVYTLFPFMVLPLFTNMERFDFRLIEAARDLGASRRQTFWRIFLPSTKPGILSGVMMVFLPAMTLFYIPQILGGARSILIGNLIQNQFLVAGDWPQGAATSIFLTFILLIFMVMYRKPWSKQS